jgi:hypothetical protein
MAGTLDRVTRVGRQLMTGGNELLSHGDEYDDIRPLRVVSKGHITLSRRPIGTGQSSMEFPSEPTAGCLTDGPWMTATGRLHTAHSPRSRGIVQRIVA